MKNKSQQESTRRMYLITLIRIGIIIAIIFPSLFNRNDRPRLLEVKPYLGAMIVGQKHYFLENNTFTDDIEKLVGIGMKNETNYYRYSIQVNDNAVFNYGIARSDVYRTEYIFWFIPWRVKVKLKSYVGGVFLVPATQVDANPIATILCETNSPSTTKPAQPTYKDGVLACGEGTKEI